jgi:hypothetical protein
MASANVARCVAATAWLGTATEWDTTRRVSFLAAPPKHRGEDLTKPTITLANLVKHKPV